VEKAEKETGKRHKKIKTDKEEGRNGGPGFTLLLLL
jgi:hypothetical protein